MAVYLVSASGQRLALRPGTWWLGADAAGRLALGAESGGLARLEVQPRSIVVEPAGGAVAVNGSPASDPVRLKPGDQVTVAGETLVLEVASAPAAPPAAAPPIAPPAAAPPRAAPAPMPASNEVGVALPPPDPPKWRLLLGVITVLLAVAVVAAVLRLVPRVQPKPEAAMAAEVRQKVKAATVWIRVDGDRSQGSGFVSKPGWVVTNAHVVHGGKSVSVVFNSGTRETRQAPARIVRAGAPGTPTDIAVLKTETGAAPTLSLANVDQLDDDTTVLAFGFPLGSTLSASSRGPVINVRGGKVTAVQRDDSGRPEWINSDISAEVGNSGGPVVTLDAKVVGLATMLVGPNLRIVQIVPATQIRRFAPEAVH